MGVKPMENPPSPAVIETVEDIMKLYKSLPPRPSIEEVEAAMSVIKTVETEEEQKLEEISKQVVLRDVPEELFSVLQQVRRTMVLFQSHEQRKEASEVVEFDKMFQTFDGLIQRTSELVSGDTQKENHGSLGYSVGEIVREPVISDRGLVVMKKKEDEKLKTGGFKGLVKSSSTISTISAGLHHLIIVNL